MYVVCIANRWWEPLSIANIHAVFHCFLVLFLLNLCNVACLLRRTQLFWIHILLPYVVLDKQFILVSVFIYVMRAQSTQIASSSWWTNQNMYEICLLCHLSHQQQISRGDVVSLPAVVQLEVIVASIKKPVTDPVLLLYQASQQWNVIHLEGFFCVEASESADWCFASPEICQRMRGMEVSQHHITCVLTLCTLHPGVYTSTMGPVPSNVPSAATDVISLLAWDIFSVLVAKCE